MKRMRWSRAGRKITALSIILVLVLICSISAMAATSTTGIYLGSGNVYYANGDIDYDVRGYVYYNSNNASSLDLSSMVQWVYNYGVYEVNESHFEAHDGEFINYTQAWGYINGITAGENARIEADWESVCASNGKSHVYAKNNTDKFAYTSMVSGYSYGGLGGWSSYWFQTTREDDFHF